MYDIISVMCGLGILKRKTDALDWTLSELDKTAGTHHFSLFPLEASRVRSTYNKGNNIMICIQSYLYNKDTLLGIPESETISVDDVWEYVLRTFIQQDMVLVIDIPYFQKTLQLREYTPVTVSIPAIPAASLQPDEVSFGQMGDADGGGEINFRGNLMFASHHIATFNETPTALTTFGTKMGKMGKMGPSRRTKMAKIETKTTKRSMKRHLEDEEWKLPHQRKEPRRTKKLSKSEISGNEMRSSFQEKSLLLSGLDGFSVIEKNETIDVPTSGKEKIALILSPSRASSSPSPFMMVMSPDRASFSILPSPIRLDSLPPFPFSPNSIGFSPIRGSTAENVVTELIPTFSEKSPIVLPILPALPEYSVGIVNKDTSQSVPRKSVSPSPSSPFEAHQ